MYVMKKLTKWEEYPYLLELSYNKNYHASIKMSPNEALYGHICRTPINWSGPKEKLMLGHDFLKEMELIMSNERMILKVAKNR